MVKIKDSLAVETRKTIADELKKYFMNIGINQYEYNIANYSETLTSEIMEEYLYKKGQSLFFKDPTFDYMNLPFVNYGGLNVYNRPVKFRAIGLGYNKAYTIDNSVIIRNNAMCQPTKTLVDYYCEKLADIELTIDLHRNAHKTPIMIYTDENTELTARNIYNDITANEPVLYRNKSKVEAGKIPIDVFNPNVTYIGDKLMDEYNCYVAKILTVLGINNYVEDKAERVQSAEVNAQEEYIIKSYMSGLEQREKACDQINKMFGIKLEVKNKKLEIPSLNKDNNEEDDEGDDQNA